MPCRCLGLCAWEGLVSWRQEPPREPAFWSPEPLKRAGGMLAWLAAELISWRVAECGRHTRQGGAISWLENRGGQFSPREGLRPTESHSFRVPQLFSHSDGKEAWPGERAWPKVTGKAEPGPWRADGGSGRGQGHQHGRH